MPRLRKAGNLDYNNQEQIEDTYYTFVAGLNTDANPLSPPKDSSIDEENFVLNVNGSRRRRKGLALESGGTPIYVTRILFGETPTVLDSTGAHFAETDRQFVIDWLHFEYDADAGTLTVWWNMSLHGKTPWVVFDINGDTYTLDSHDADGSWTVLTNTYFYKTFNNVNVFPAVADTPAVTVYASTSLTDGYVRAHRWNNVAGRDDVNYMVCQFGSELRIYKDDVIISAETDIWFVSLYDMRADSSTTEETISTTPVSCAYGRGHFFCVGPYTEPFYIEWDPDKVGTDEEFTVKQIVLKERDLVDIDDGISVDAQPVTLTNEHKYNLINRGWKEADITAYFASKAKYPAKNMIPWQGYRAVETTKGALKVGEVDWTKEFSPDKLVAELFQDVSSPIGHTIRDVFDHKIIITTTGTPLVVTAVSPASFTGTAYSGTTQTVTLTTESNHGLAPGDFIQITGWDIGGISGAWNGPYGTFNIKKLSNRYQVVGTPTAATFTINVVVPTIQSSTGTYYLAWTSPVATVTKQTLVTPANLRSTFARPYSVGFYAGRVWYGGIGDARYSHKLYFTQIVENEKQYNKCHSIADPTSQNISDPLPNDGGFIAIPEMDLCTAMLQWGTSLLVFATNGVWMISGGDNAPFTPYSYNVRRISSIGCISETSVGLAEGIPMYWGDGAIYAIQQDSNSGFLTAKDITTGKIQSYYTSLSRDTKSLAQFSYDRALKKAFWLYNEEDPSGYFYTRVLTLDLRLGGAFSKYKSYTPDNYLLKSLFAIDEYSTEGDYRNIKFIVFNETDNKVYFSELNNEDFEDFGVDAAAFLETAYGNEQDAARRKYALYVTTFAGRTQTGWIDNGDDTFTPVNPGGCLLSGKWNWSDSSSANKWTTPQEIYRERFVIPAVSTEVPPFKVIPAKSKIRGSGRALQLRFESEPGKDCYILGWHVAKKVNLGI